MKGFFSVTTVCKIAMSMAIATILFVFLVQKYERCVRLFFFIESFRHSAYRNNKKTSFWVVVMITDLWGPKV